MRWGKPWTDSCEEKQLTLFLVFMQPVQDVPKWIDGWSHQSLPKT